jgi:hypothetical protein
MLISQELKKRVESRDAAAMRELAILYLNENNTDKAVLWMEKAAKFGDAESQFEMACECYEKNDFNASYQWVLRSAKQGFPKAQHDLAILYQDGKGTPKNPEKQFYWHLQAAKNGVIDSKYLLAVCYLTEVGTPQDLKKAVYWLEQASNEGHAKAKTRLGAAYIEGIGVSVDKEKGVSLLRDAVALGDDKAKELLREAEKSRSSRGSSEDSYEVKTAKKEIRILLICSGIGFILGVIFGANNNFMGFYGIESVLFGMWFGIGVGGILSYIPLIPRILKTAHKEKGSDGVGDLLGSLFIGGIIWFFIFGVSGPIGLLIRVLKKKSQIRKLQKNG